MARPSIRCPRCGKPARIPARSAVGVTFPCPHCGVPLKLSAPRQSQPATDSHAGSEIPIWDPPAPESSANSQNETSDKGVPLDFIPSDLPATHRSAAEEAAFERPVSPTLRAFRTRRKRRLGVPLVPASVAVGLLIVGALFVWDRASRHGTEPNRDATEVVDKPLSPDIAHSEVALAHRTGAPASNQRQPIRLLLVPDGARIIIHLRTSALWSAADRVTELRRCLGPLSEWAEQQITTRCLYPPSEINEVLFAFVLRSRDEPPDVAATVWLASPATKQDVVQRFGGAPRREKLSAANPPIYVRGDRALVIRDARTFAVGPESAADEMAAAAREQNPTDESIEELLKQTDRSRELTLVFRPDDLDRFREAMFPPELLDAVHRVANWLDPDSVEGVVLSARLADPFRLRLILRNRPATPVSRLEEDVQKRLDRLPADLLARVKPLRPSTIGYRKVIGRVPAMWKAVAIGTSSTVDPRLVTFESVLPPLAAANLSLGMYLAMAEAPSEAGSSSNPAAPESRRESPKTIVERLKAPIEVDFRRTPLSEAFDWIGDSTGTKFEIDGGALKLAGYTKNMPQTFKAPQIPALDVLRTILKPYAKMALVVDEAHQKVVVTTIEAAKESRQKTLPLK